MLAGGLLEEVRADPASVEQAIWSASFADALAGHRGRGSAAGNGK
jgi:hypothetical protein